MSRFPFPLIGNPDSSAAQGNLRNDESKQIRLASAGPCGDQRARRKRLQRNPDLVSAAALSQQQLALGKSRFGKGVQLSEYLLDSQAPDTLEDHACDLLVCSTVMPCPEKATT